MFASHPEVDKLVKVRARIASGVKDTHALALRLGSRWGLG